MFNKAFRTAARAVAAAGLALAVSALGGLPAAAEPMKLKLTFPTDVATFELPYFIANDTGWFKEHGLEVEEIWVTGDSNALRTVLAGTSDVTPIGLSTAFDAMTGGAKIVSIGSWQPVVDYQLVGKKDTIKTLADLQGKTLASAEPGGLTTEIPRMLMQKHGLDSKSVKFIRVGGHGDRYKAVVAGKTEGAMINTLTATKGQMDGEITVLASLAKEFPGLGYVQLITTQAHLADPARRKAFEVFLEGSIHGARFIMQNPEEATKIFHKRIPAMDFDLAFNVIKELNSIGVWGVNGGAEMEVVEYTARVSQELGMLSKPVDPKDALDPSLAKEILARVGTF